MIVENIVSLSGQWFMLIKNHINLFIYYGYTGIKLKSLFY